MAVASDAADDDLAELGRCGFALAVQLLRNREDAADAVQDALHAALRKRHRFDPRRGHLRAWFLKIVRNRCLDVLRKRSRRRDQDVVLQEVAAPGPPRPDVAAERQELLDMVRRELMQMPPPQREILLLRDYHDLSYAEIAQVLSIPVGTVMSRLHRARSELRRRLPNDR
jgi:RNA polymerase sigma-70 factor (ECF subfamily)